MTPEFHMDDMNLFWFHCHYQNNTAYQTKKPEGVTDVLKIYMRHHVEFNKSEIAHIVLTPNFQKIPDDLKYYQRSLDQHSEVLRSVSY